MNIASFALAAAFAAVLGYAQPASAQTQDQTGATTRSDPGTGMDGAMMNHGMVCGIPVHLLLMHLQEHLLLLLRCELNEGAYRRLRDQLKQLLIRIFQRFRRFHFHGLFQQR